MGTMTDFPNVAEILGPLLQRVSPERRPLLLALAECRAAERYRRWADACTDGPRRAELLGCARREDEIACRVEALNAASAAIQREILAANPELEEINHAIFADRPLRQQFAIQAQGERLGAATWRALADNATDPAVRETLLACAKLEEDSAVVLEAILSKEPT